MVKCKKKSVPVDNVVLAVTSVNFHTIKINLAMNKNMYIQDISSLELESFFRRSNV